MPAWLRRTTRLVLLGIPSGALTSFLTIFPLLAIRGQARAIALPVAWAYTAGLGAILGAIVLPVLGWWALPNVPLRRVVLVVGGSVCLGALLIGVLGNAMLGALGGAIAAVSWLRYLEPALAPPRKPAVPSYTAR